MRDKAKVVMSIVACGIAVHLASSACGASIGSGGVDIKGNNADVDLNVEGRVTESRGKCTIFDCKNNISVIEVTRRLSASKALTKLVDADIAVISICSETSLFLGKTYRLSLIINEGNGAKIPLDYSNGLKASDTCQFIADMNALYIESGSSWLKVDPSVCKPGMMDDEICVYARK